VQSLPGHIGSHDVEDCRAAVAAVVAAGYCDGSRVGIFGGSHGGFLAASLVGQYPDEFAAAVLRNPVTDLSLMVHVTDIPDWCYVEAWGSKEGLRRLSQQPSEEDIARFRSVSPVGRVGDIKAAMLFLLGAKDERCVGRCDGWWFSTSNARRVPMDDGKRIQWALLAREDPPPVRTILFEGDNHALDRPQTEVEQLLNTAWWFDQYLR
jgi:acylaminoacyl-peptidase